MRIATVLVVFLLSSSLSFALVPGNCEIVVLIDERVPAGRHETVLDGSELASGVYLVRMEAGGTVQGLRKVVLLR